MKTFVILPARMKSSRLPNKLIKKIGEGLVEKKKGNIKANQNLIYEKKKNYGYLKLPEVKRNKFEIVIDPGHGGPDPGAIGIGGIRETDVVLEVSKIV